MGKKVINMILLLVIAKESINKIELNNNNSLKDMINKFRDHDKGIIIAKRNSKNIVNIIKKKKKRKKDILHNKILQNLDQEIKGRSMIRKSNINKNILNTEDMIHNNNLAIGIKNDIQIIIYIMLNFISFK
jgi:hypothetical protein